MPHYNKLTIIDIKIIMDPASVDTGILSKSGYWYQRAKTSRIAYTSTSPNTKRTSPQREQKELELNLTYIERQSKKVTGALQKLSKIQDYYQIMCGGSGEFNKNMGIRCYEHNNQVILYCVNDHRLLCANCMFTGHPVSLQPETDPAKAKQAQSKHANHEVKQTQKANIQIAGDVKTWQFELQQVVSSLASCEMEWEKGREGYNKIKDKLLKELDKEYDRIQMQLSKAFLAVKKEIEELSRPIEQCLERTISAYRTMKKLIIPQRYPIPIVKHAWLQYMKRLATEIPLEQKQISSSWLKSYESQLKSRIKKLNLFNK